LLFSLLRRPPPSPLFPYTTLFRSLPFGSLSGPFGVSCTRCLATIRAIFLAARDVVSFGRGASAGKGTRCERNGASMVRTRGIGRSEEHTSELQSRFDLVCRLLLEK